MPRHAQASKVLPEYTLRHAFRAIGTVRSPFADCVGAPRQALLARVDVAL